VVGKGFVYVVLEKEEATRVVFLNNVWMIVGSLAYVQPQYETYSSVYAFQHKYPLWMEFPRIPEHFQACIVQIVQPFGQLIVGDKRVTHNLRPNACVFVEVDL